MQEICNVGEWNDFRTPGRKDVSEDIANEEAQLRAMVVSDDEEGRLDESDQSPSTG